MTSFHFIDAIHCFIEAGVEVQLPNDLLTRVSQSICRILVSLLPILDFGIFFLDPASSFCWHSDATAKQRQREKEYNEEFHLVLVECGN